MTRTNKTLRVLDLTEPEGHLCGRILGDLGAEVIKIEPPEGDPGRRIGPFNGHMEDLESSLPFCYFNANKKSVVIDFSTGNGRNALTELVLTADVVIDTASPSQMIHDKLDYVMLRNENRGLINASITGFGLSGPYSGYKAPSIVCGAMGGVMSLCGTPDRPPITEPHNQPYHLASAFAATGILLALRLRDRTGVGQEVEVSCQEVQAAEQHTIVNYSSNKTILKRAGSRTPIGGGMPYGVYPAKDGFCHLVVISTQHWRNFVEWIGKPEALSDPIWENRHVRIANREFIENLVTRFTSKLSKSELFIQGQARHITVAPINTPVEFLSDDHVKESKLFQSIYHPVLGNCNYVRPPFKLSETPAKMSCPAPLLGEHTKEILSIPGPRRSVGRSIVSKIPSLPLTGIRVLDFTQAVAGPVLTQLLASFGAEVIKVESNAHQQRGRVRVGMDQRVLLQQRVTFADINRNKRSITVNMNKDDGRSVIKRLIPYCDVVIENFSPRVMDKWGLGYTEVRKLKSDIIMMRLPGFGLSGPYKNYVGLAGVAMAITGLYKEWSYAADGEPDAPPIWVPDYFSAAFGGVSLLTALRHRDETGQGQLIELSQVNATAFVMGPTYLGTSFDECNSDMTRGKATDYFPYRAYRCKGQDAWCVIGVRNEKEWVSLTNSLKDQHELSSPKYATGKGRYLYQKEIDTYIGVWTSSRSPLQVMKQLQRSGVPAGMVQDGKGLFNDSHLRKRGFISTVYHSSTGPIDYPQPPIRLSESPGSLSWWHDIGEDNDYVLREIMKTSQKDIKRLKKNGVLS